MLDKQAFEMRLTGREIKWAQCVALGQCWGKQGVIWKSRGWDCTSNSYMLCTIPIPRGLEQSAWMNNLLGYLWIVFSFTCWMSICLLVFLWHIFAILPNFSTSVSVIPQPLFVPCLLHMSLFSWSVIYSNSALCEETTCPSLLLHLGIAKGMIK